MNWGRLFFGLVIIGVGAIWLLGNADVIDAGDVFAMWWPAVIIIGGVVSFAANPRHWPVALLITAVGVAVLLSTLDVIDVTNVVIPVVVIGVGLIVIFGRRVGSRTETGDTVNAFVIFSGSEVASRSQSFEGGSVTALFGGAEVDLRDAMPTADAAIDVFVAFGGAEITVPVGWEVATKGFPLFGAIENVTAKDSVPLNAPRLVVNATALFGGVEIKH